MDPRYHAYHPMPSDTAPGSAYQMPLQQRAPALNGGGEARRMAPEDVDGALRYSPLTSVVPVSGVLNTLSLPHFTHYLPTRLEVNPEQQQRTQEYFNLMNRDAHTSAETNFQRDEFRNTVHLINQIDDRQFRFKTPPYAPTQSQPPTRPPVTPNTPGLGVFAQAVLTQTTSNFRYPTPLTPENPPFASDRKYFQPQANISPTPNLTVTGPNQRPELKASQQPQLSPPKKQKFAVEILARPLQPTPASSVASSGYKRQKISHDQERSASPTPTRRAMEKDRVDGLVSQFVSFLEDIFEAEDAFNPNADHPTEGSSLFFSSDSLREEKPWLSRETHRKLDGHLRKLGKTIAAREGLRINAGDLARITGICERAVKAAETVDLKEIDGEEDAEREWVVGKLQKVENAILAANVIMLLITGRGTDQQIYSEETLKSIVEVLRIFLDTLFHWISSGSSENNSSDTFSAAMSCNRQISALLQSSITLLSQFENQLAETVSQENIINVLQFLAVEAIFIENQAKDKEFVVTNQGIESLRVVSMGILRQVFASYPEQRSFILDEVLSSLAKLPANRQQARHFKLLDGKSIQLVSALMMRLVQACGACFSVRDVDLTSLTLMDNEQDGEDSKRLKRLQLFADEWTSASRAAHQSATYIVSYLTSRALQTNKTAPTDSPFKALLDIFIEDFLTVLTAPEWPAAELLLRCLVKNLYVCIDSDSLGAQVKNVALEAVGQIAAKIRAIRKKLTMQLKLRAEESTDASSLSARIFEYTTGPSLTLEELRDIQEAYSLIWAKSDGGMRDALRFQVCGWALFVLSTDKVDEEENVPRRSTPLVEELAKIARAGKAQYDSLSLPSDLEVSLACTTLLSRSPLFQSYDTMLSRILRSMSEKQPTFRTKALRTLGQIIVADLDILSLSNVQHQVALRISDPSPAVREAAIELVAKHIASDPVLGKEYYEVMRARINDTGLGVRKRVIKLLKDIYSKSDDRSMQAQIAGSILSRITDEEHSVRELAVKTMEELWFMPAGEEIDMNGTFDFVRLNIKAQKTIRARTMAMVRVIGENEDRKVALFKRLLRTMCSETGKPGKALQTRFDACKLSVHCLYEIALNDAAEAKMANFKRCLLVISLFARSTPSVFSADQMTNLEPYLKGASDKDDQEIAYLVVVIYRTLLAVTQLTFQPEFLGRTMTTIATSMSSVSLKYLKESVPAVCLIAGMLNDYSNIIKVVQTCFRLVTSSQKAIDTAGLNAANPTLIRCLYLLGLFAQHAKIDAQAELFRPALGLAKNVPVTAAIARALAAFTKPVVPEALRKIAITSYGFLCLGNTEFFKSETSDAQQIITSALRGDSVTLKRTILEIFQEYFAIEEHKAELLEGKDKEDIDLSADIGVLTGTAKTVNTDEASFFLAGNYLEDIMVCALSDSMPLAIAGTEVLESIVRGGLAAPNDWFPALVALETSPVPRVRQMSSRSRVWAIVRYEHVIEGAYSHAMQKMFDYRKTVLNSVKGYQMEGDEPVSLMSPLYRDIKTKKRFRLRFLKSLVNLLDRDSQSRESTSPISIDLARFIVENLMYLEYGAIEEVHTVIHTIDSIMSSTGISLLQSFESGDKSESMTVLAHRSTVLSLLVGLKQNLKFSYGLTEAKCRAFDPKKAGGAKDNKSAVRQKGSWIFEWDDIPYLEKPPQDIEQMQEQLQAFAALMHRDDVVGSHEVNSTSDDETQNASTKDDDDAVTVMTTGTGEDDDMSQGGPGTPAKKNKKRKEGSENGSFKKKQKKVESIVVQKW